MRASQTLIGLPEEFDRISQREEFYRITQGEISGVVRDVDPAAIRPSCHRRRVAAMCTHTHTQPEVLPCAA